jgi:hypothetical protein
MEYKWNTSRQRLGPGATDKPALANETKKAYPFVRKSLTKGFCVCRQGQKPATVLSSPIEGTQSSLSDLILFENDEVPGVPLNDDHRFLGPRVFRGRRLPG